MCPQKVRITIIIVTFCAVSGANPIPAAPGKIDTDQQDPAVLDMIDSYDRARNKLKSFIVKSETYYPGRTITLPGGRKILNEGIHPSTVEKRTDGTRFYVCKRNSTAFMLFPQPAIPGDFKSRTRVWDGRFYYSYSSHSERCIERRARELVLTDKKRRERVFDRMRGNITIYADANDPRVKQMIDEDRPVIAPGLGIPSTFRKVAGLSLCPETEVINGSKCRIIEAHVGQRKYKIWIDPAHGYNAAKVIWWAAGKKRYMSWNIRFKSFEGVWLPVENDFQFFNSDGKIPEGKNRFKLTKVVINPDHDALKSFLPVPKEDSVVRVSGCENICETDEYRWRKGKLVDGKGREVYCETGGRSLPIPCSTD